MMFIVALFVVQALSGFGPNLKRSVIAGIEASPTLLVLIPAYILYAEHDKLGKDPLSAYCEKRIRRLLDQVNYGDTERLNLRKINPCFFINNEECSLLQTVLPIKKLDNTIIAIPAPYTLYIDERACAQLTDEQLISRILPCALFVKHKILEKTILSAMITPIATDYGTRLLHYMVSMLVEAICTEVSQNHPILGKLLCSSNTALEWLLTNFITKFILNTQIIQFLTKQQLNALERHAQKLINEKHGQNTHSTNYRGSENCGGRSYRAAS